MSLDGKERQQRGPADNEVMMTHELKAHLDRAFELTQDLVAHLNESALDLDLPELPSNRVAGQMWCVVGARESYAKAIEAGTWSGFSCTLETPRNKQSVLAALGTTRSRLARVDFLNLNDAQIDLALALLEHEVQHHGQLIRFVYANGLTFPGSWNKRYAV